jgi:hypothetical protein
MVDTVNARIPPIDIVHRQFLQINTFYLRFLQIDANSTRRSFIQC